MPAWPQRAARLRALERLLTEQGDAFAAAISADFGHRPAEETQLLELYPSLSGLRHALRCGRRWMRPRHPAANCAFWPARTSLLPQPLGVVGIIVPWNYPLFLAVGPLIDALAAGNRVMLKMSEYTPRFSALFAAQVVRYFTEDEVVVVTGDAQVAQAFSALPFDHLLFTGSTPVGREVMRAAAANLTPVTLELGGKSPVIIGPTARLAHAVERILCGKLANAGQTCIAPDYVLLPRQHREAFIELAKATAMRLYPGLAAQGQYQYTTILSGRHYERLVGLRDEAVRMGARLWPLCDGQDDPLQRRLRPALLTEVSDAMAVMQQEIFGPLLPVLMYDTFDEAIAYVAAHPRPLALYLFEQDRAAIGRALSCTHAGGVTVNDTLCHIAQHHLPFGGIGPSGMGGYHGETGFRAFSHIKPVFWQSRLSGVRILNPPYGARFRWLLGWLLRHG